MNERDTHFQGFAKLLLDRLMNKFDHLPPGEWGPAESDELIIAQAAHDFAMHVLLYSAGESWIDSCPPEEWVERIPDLTSWPDTSPQ